MCVHVYTYMDVQLCVPGCACAEPKEVRCPALSLCPISLRNDHSLDLGFGILPPDSDWLVKNKPRLSMLLVTSIRESELRASR